MLVSEACTVGCSSSDPEGPALLFDPVIYPPFKFVLVGVIYRGLGSICGKVMVLCLCFNIVLFACIFENIPK